MKRLIALPMLCALLLLCAGCSVSRLLPSEAADALRRAEDTLTETRDTLRELGAEELLEDVKELARHSADMSDAELAEALREIAAKKGVTLGDDEQMRMLLTVCRALEKGVGLWDRLEDAKDRASDAVGTAKDKAGGVLDAVKEKLDEVKERLPSGNG